MRRLTWLTRGVRATFTRRAGNHDIDEELAFHVASRIDDLVTRGVSKEQATRQARLEFGSRDKAADECREARRFTLVEDLVRDVRHAARGLQRHPGLVAISVFSLAIGISVNTLLYSAVQAVFFVLPTAARIEELVWVQPTGRSQLAYLNYDDLRRTEGFAALFGYRSTTLGLRTEAGAERVTALAVTPNFFRALGNRAAVGRLFVDPDDEKTGDGFVVSHAFWRRRFAADPSVVGRRVQINGRDYSLIGVLPADYVSFERLADPDVYVPVSDAVLPGLHTRNDINALNIVGRLHPDHGIARARAAVAAFEQGSLPEMPRQAAAYPARITQLDDFSIARMPLAAKVFPPILALLCLFVLLIAAANVAGLLLARAVGQQRELALRAALGAPRRRLIQQLLTESLLLSGVGTGVGILLTALLMSTLRTITLPVVGAVRLHMQFDWTLSVYAALLMALTGIGCGLLPALTASRRDPGPLLQRHGASRAVTSRWRLRHLLVIGETAATVLLLVVALLFARTLGRMFTIDTGMDIDRAVISTIDLAPAASISPQVKAATQQVIDRLLATPGIEAASTAEIVPLRMDMSGARFEVERAADVGARTLVNSVGPGYFRTLGTRQIAGRDFAATDREGSASVAIVNEAFVSTHFKNESAIGRRVRAGHEPFVEIIGIVANSSMETVAEVPRPQLFYARAQRPVSSQQRPLNVLVRTVHSPQTMIRTIHDLTSRLDDNAPTRTMTLREATGFEYGFRRAGVTVFATLGLLGLLLAAVGLYGIVSYVVASQTTEFGVRMALGASRTAVLREVLWRGVRLTLWGLAVGVVLSLVAARLLTALLAGLSPADPLSFAGSAVLLIVTGMLASYLPARHATRVDPIVALRQS